MDNWPGVYRDRSLQRAVLKDAGISNTVALTVLWRILALFFVPNWFRCINSENDDTMMVLSYCDRLSRNLSLVPTCVRDVQHQSQLSYFLDTVALCIPLVILKIMLATKSRR